MAKGAEYLAGKRTYIEQAASRVAELVLDGKGPEVLAALARVRDADGDSMDARASDSAIAAKAKAEVAYASYVADLEDGWREPA